MAYDTLGFTIHRACSASCRMCCFSSNPSCTEKLRVDRIKEYIEEAKDVPEIQNVAFTGGEPFLAYRTLYELISFTSKSGMKSNTVTNGFWATNYEVAYEKLSQLMDLGLSYLSVSHDNYHREYVRTENIANIFKATTKLGLPVSLQIVKLKDEAIGHILDDIGGSIYTASIKVGPCLSAGAAATNFSSEQFDRTIESKGIRCPYGGNLAIFYDGTIYPCCSQVVTDSCLALGNFEDISLAEALSRAKNNALLYFLRNTNMDFFTEYAREMQELDIPQYVVSPCELCSILFKKENSERYHSFVMENIKRVKRESVLDQNYISNADE